jgi:hypothetical protein
VLDEILSLARRVGDASEQDKHLIDQLVKLQNSEPAIRDLLRYRLPGEEKNRATATGSDSVFEEIWMRVAGLVLRLFPGTGNHAYCKSFGDVSPLALEAVFDQPIQELELNLTLLRSLLISSVYENEEIASVILGQIRPTTT